MSFSWASETGRSCARAEPCDECKALAEIVVLMARAIRKRLDADGVSHREIAQRLGISHAYVIQVEQRAMDKLRRALGRAAVA